jgi:hypothetical protein
LGALLGKLKAQILEFDRQINAWHRSNEMSRRLDNLSSMTNWSRFLCVSCLPG